MAFRFRKSIQIIPGVKVNISKNGISSLTVGKRGATMNFSAKGTKATVGIPGTGLSWTERLNAKADAMAEERKIARPHREINPKLKTFGKIVIVVVGCIVGRALTNP